MLQKINGNIVVVGRRWFQKTYGNTYHSVSVYVNGATLTVPFQYGYGDHYKQTAHELLKRQGYDVPDSYFDFIGLENMTCDVFDVSRKCDL